MRRGAERMRRYDRLSGGRKSCRSASARRNRAGAYFRRRPGTRNAGPGSRARGRSRDLPAKRARGASVSGGSGDGCRGVCRAARLEAAVYCHERPAGSAAVPLACRGDRRRGDRRGRERRDAGAALCVSAAHGFHAAARAHALVPGADAAARHRRRRTHRRLCAGMLVFLPPGALEEALRTSPAGPERWNARLAAGRAALKETLQKETSL